VNFFSQMQEIEAEYHYFCEILIGGGFIGVLQDVIEIDQVFVGFGDIK